MIKTAPGITAAVGLVGTAVFAAVRQLHKDSSIKADKAEYEQKAQMIRDQFTEEELDEMNKKADKKNVISEFLSWIFMIA